MDGKVDLQCYVNIFNKSILLDAEEILDEKWFFLHEIAAVLSYIPAKNVWVNVSLTSGICKSFN